jgi:hypothetical protein
VAYDAHLSSVKLHLKCQGANGSTTIIDSSPSAHTLTAVGNAQLSTAQGLFSGASSLLMDGAGDYLTVPHSTDFSIQGGDFTLEEVIDRDATGVMNYLASKRPAAASTGWEWRVNASDQLQFFHTGGSVSTSTGTIPTGLVYVKTVRTGSTIKHYKALIGVDTVATLIGTTNSITNGTENTDATLKIGVANDLSGGFDGYRGSFRLTKGVARDDTTVPTDFFPVRGDVDAGFNSTVFGTPNLGHVASGWQATVFGSPRVITLIGTATGIASTVAFGTPRNVPNALGFNSTVFGTPNVKPIAEGWVATVFGSATAIQRNRASAIKPVTRFGTPTTPTNRTGEAQAFAPIQFGLAQALRYLEVDLDRTLDALSVGRVTRFGLAVAQQHYRCTVTGLAAGTLFGTPVSEFGQRATGIASTLLFGTPAASFDTYAEGLAAGPTFGTPTHRRTQAASSVTRTARFGTPRQWGPHMVYPWIQVARFGRATALNRFNYPATGFGGTTFGTPACVQRHRATALVRSTAFGTPLLVRNPSC